MSFAWAKPYEPKTELGRWVDERMPLPRLVYNAVGGGYPVPRNLNYGWNFGVLSGVFLVIQIVTGIVLALWYFASADGAFNSVEHIMRDVNRLDDALRPRQRRELLLHRVYIHIFRAFTTGPTRPARGCGCWAWHLPVDDGTAFRAMSSVGADELWGAQVITASSRPFRSSASDPVGLGAMRRTGRADRFFSLHYLLPFVIAGVVILHIWSLHIPGSGNPTGVDVKSEKDTLPFHPFYTAKDGWFAGLFLIFYAAVVFYAPNALGHADNYIPANPLATPAHIVPEWYFWPFTRSQSFTSTSFCAKRGVVWRCSLAPAAVFRPWPISHRALGLHRPLFKRFSGG